VDSCMSTPTASAWSFVLGSAQVLTLVLLVLVLRKVDL
jgi:hypothetical protein